MSVKKITQACSAVLVAVAISSDAMAAVNILFPSDGSDHNKSQPLGTYGMTAPNKTIHVRVRDGTRSVFRECTSDANGFWATSFTAPEGGWTVGAGDVKAWRDDDPLDADIHDITFTN